MSTSWSTPPSPEQPQSTPWSTPISRAPLSALPRTLPFTCGLEVRHAMLARYHIKARKRRMPPLSNTLKAARLQSDFCTKSFFELRIFCEKCSGIFPEMFEPLFRGFSTKFPAKFPCENLMNRKELLQERREQILSHQGWRFYAPLLENIEWGVFGTGIFQITDLSSNPTSQ